MGILEAARALGAEIQKDERFIAYAKAKIENDSNEDLQEAIGNFNTIRMNLDMEMSKETPDEEKIQELNERLRVTYSAIMSTGAMLNYNNAKANLDAMLNDINSIIMQCVEGAEPSTCEPETHSCSGSCSSCSGCH